MAAFFTSDTHFGDHRVLNLYPRPFGSVAEMDAAMIKNWNAVVGEDDEVWHLGDFARAAKQAAELLPRLNGRKHLVLGNNDPSAVADLGWASVSSYAETELDGVSLVLCHYPFRSWNGMHRGAVNLHGHSHGRLRLSCASSTSAWTSITGRCGWMSCCLRSRGALPRPVMVLQRQPCSGADRPSRRFRDP